MNRPSSRGRERQRRERRVLFAASALTGFAVLATLVVALRISKVDARSDPGAARAGVLAVLPFQPLVPDPETAYLGIGLADSIIDHLSSVPGLTVRPMSAALAAVRDDPDPVKAAQSLQAKATLVGRYQQAGSRIQVSVQLVDAETGFTLWGRTFESGIDDLIGLEREVIDATRATLMPDMKDDEEIRRDAHGTRDATAHYLYMLARGKLATWESERVPDAVELLERAIQADPGFAAAHASLGEASTSMFYGGLTDDATWIDRAIASGRRSIYLDGTDPYAHYALGYTLMVAGDPAEAAREALRALELDPEYSYAQLLLGGLLSRAGAARPARDLSERAKRSGIIPEIGWVDVQVAIVEGRETDLVVELERMLDRRLREGRNSEQTVMHLGYLAFHAGDAAAGLQWAARLEQVSANKVYADAIRMMALALTGDAPAVRLIVEKNRVAFQRDWEYCEWISMALALVGENEEALGWLERSARLGACDLHLIDTNAAFDPLRTDERFHEVASTVRERARDIIQLAAFAGYR